MRRRQYPAVDDLRAVSVVGRLVEIDQLAAISQQRVRLMRMLAIGRCTHRAASRASATTSCLPFAVGRLWRNDEPTSARGWHRKPVEVNKNDSAGCSDSFSSGG